MQTHKRITLSPRRPVSSSCEGFDIRLPAADAAATANASAAQSLKQQWKTATNMTKRWGKLLAAEELRLVRKRRKILTLASALEFSASPAGLSWLNRALLLYCGHDTHSRCLPAFCPPAPTKSPNPATAERPERLIFSPPTKREGVEKGELWLLFWSLHVPPRSCQTVSTVACRKRQDNNPYSLPSYTPPAPSQTHAHLCPPTTTTRALLLSRNEQKSIRMADSRELRPLLQRGHLERPDPTQCHRHSGDVISEGKNIMQHYLPLQVAQDGARLHLPPDILYIKKEHHTISQRHRTHK